MEDCQAHLFMEATSVACGTLPVPTIYMCAVAFTQVITFNYVHTVYINRINQELNIKYSVPI